MVSLTNINARLISLWTGITHIQIDIDKICTFLDTLLVHIVSLLFLSPSVLRNILENIKQVWHNIPNNPC